MAKILETPEFKSDEEEALWWANNQDLIASALEDAAKSGTLGHGTVARRSQIPTTTIRLDRGDIELAREQAAQRGLKYQTYLKMLIHQALVSEAQGKLAGPGVT